MASPRLLLVVLASIMLAAACAPAAPPAGSPPGASPTSDAGAGATDAGAGATDEPAPSPLASPLETSVPDPLETVDVAIVDQLVDSGLEEDEALFLAATTLDARLIAPRQYLIVASFPTDSTAQITVTLELDQLGEPDAEEPLRIRHAATEDAFTFTLEYFIAYESLPPDVVDQLRAQASRARPAAAGGQALALAGPAFPALTTASQQSGIAVQVEAVVKNFAMDGLKKFAEAADQWLTKRYGKDTGGPGSKPKSPFTKALAVIEGALAINDALGLSNEYQTMMQQIDELEECARNPTSRVTRETYERDPSQKQRVLDGIEAIRTEIKANLVVMYIGLLNETGSGLVNFPGLGYVVGAGTAWSMNTLRRVNAQLIEELRKAIPPCEWTLRVEYRVLTNFSDGGISGTVTRDGEARVPLKKSEGGGVRGTSPITLRGEIRLSADYMTCQGEWQDQLTISVEGAEERGVLALRTDWSKYVSTSVGLTCNGIRRRENPHPIGRFPPSSPLISGFELPARDGETRQFDFPEIHTTMVLTLVRQEE